MGTESSGKSATDFSADKLAAQGHGDVVLMLKENCSPKILAKFLPQI